MHSREVINEAKRRLEHPIDAAHGVEHHRAVAGNCARIVEAENLTVDEDVLTIAAWWHDLETQRGGTGILREYLLANGYPAKTADSVCEIVEEHTYGQKQTSIEAKVLYDADKMEYFNPERMKQAIQDARRSVLPIAILKKHYGSWSQRYRQTLESFYFPYSRQIVQSRLSETLTVMGQMRDFLVKSG